MSLAERVSKWMEVVESITMLLASIIPLEMIPGSKSWLVELNVEIFISAESGNPLEISKYKLPLFIPEVSAIVKSIVSLMVSWFAAKEKGVVRSISRFNGWFLWIKSLWPETLPSGFKSMFMLYPSAVGRFSMKVLMLLFEELIWLLKIEGITAVSYTHLRAHET